MKNIFIGIISLLIFVFINGCSRTTEPQLRVMNEQLTKVNLNVQTSGGNKFSINDIESGQTTSYQTISEGNITATDVVLNESVSFIAVKNTHYTIIINAGKPLSFHVDQ